MGRLDRLLQWARASEAQPAATRTPSEYVCRGCETAYEIRYYVCPECGGFSVDRRLPSDD